MTCKKHNLRHVAYRHDVSSDNIIFDHLLNNQNIWAFNAIENSILLKKIKSQQKSKDS